MPQQVAQLTLALPSVTLHVTMKGGSKWERAFDTHQEAVDWWDCWCPSTHKLVASARIETTTILK